MSIKYSALGIEQTLEQLLVDAGVGISQDEAQRRRNASGLNVLDMQDKEPFYAKFIAQFQNPMILLLLASALVSVLIGHADDAISIALTILIVLSVAFFQEYQSEKSLAALNELAPPECHVLRNGATTTQLANLLVPGDIIRFRHGDRIPADARLIQAIDLELDESSLTGETEPVRKKIDAINAFGSSLPLSERHNIVFMGTLVRHGHGSAVVIGTGNDTELGLVCKLMNNIETPRTPLQNNMDQLGKHLSYASFVVIFFIVLLGIAQGKQLLDVFTVAVSLAVAAIPEGLPIVVTVTLALGVIRMSKKHAIVKKLPAVESLGAVNVICMDKTGTLTLNKMTVTEYYTYADDCTEKVERLVSATESARLLFRTGRAFN